ncbi:hypothetical protein M9435_005020 [Picochlorum sp. BPE23]|nr:hypothetical protein M9435_005020 [Picochlorum sp. BPE23]
MRSSILRYCCFQLNSLPQTYEWAYPEGILRPNYYKINATVRCRQARDALSCLLGYIYITFQSHLCSDLARGRAVALR